MDVAFLVCTACGADAQSIPEVRSGYPDSRLRVIATIGVLEGQLLVVPHLPSCWRLSAARDASEYPSLNTRLAGPGPDDLAFARETLRPNASNDEVTNLAEQRLDREG